eukprot:gb/GFBE01034521.1/.p1 GENE.gb/GFBE01034521.1/~~gb/GFBE01034521.1/.p1  ORF type:complete len:155 (+),score=42.18 gb/GFBE01034521.1/:1-465(+)
MAMGEADGRKAGKSMEGTEKFDSKLDGQYTGTVTGHYRWGPKIENKKADPLPGPVINEYAWADGKRYVSVYVTLPGLDFVADDALFLSHEARSATFSCKLGGERHTLKLEPLSHEIANAKIVHKKGKDTVVLRLEKKDGASSWTTLLSKPLRGK